MSKQIIIKKKKIIESSSKYEKYLKSNSNDLTDDHIEKYNELLAHQKEMMKQLDKVSEIFDLLTDKIITIENDVKDMKKTINSITDDSNDYLFYLIKYNDKKRYDKKIFDYYVMLTKKVSVNSKIKSIKSNHPNMEVIYKITCPQKMTNLWIKIRDELRILHKIDGLNYEFSIINNYTEAKLIKFIQNTHDGVENL